MKTEMYHHCGCKNHLSARATVMEYIAGWCNRRRPYSNNQGLLPAGA
ncbi:IS3 family transposase [Corynebacterium suranareeae]